MGYVKIMNMLFYNAVCTIYTSMIVVLMLTDLCIHILAQENIRKNHSKESI